MWFEGLARSPERLCSITALHAGIPMTLPLLRNLSALLQQPKGVAMLASVGFHGACFMGLALLPGADGRPLRKLRMVSLISPPPEEQAQSIFSEALAPPPPLGLSPLELPPLPDGLDLPLPQESQAFFNNPNLPIANVPLQSLPVQPSQTVPLPQPQSDKPPPVPPPNAAGPQNSKTSNPLPTLSPGSVPPQPQGATAPLADNFEQGVPGKVTQWIAQNRQQLNAPQLVSKRINLPFDYPQAACQGRFQGEALLAAVFDAKGQLIGVQEAIAGSNLAVQTNPGFLQRTGHPILDDAAMATVRRFQPPVTGQVQAYLIPFGFDPAQGCPLAPAQDQSSPPAQDRPAVKPNKLPPASTQPQGRPSQPPTPLPQQNNGPAAPESAPEATSPPPSPPPEAKASPRAVSFAPEPAASVQQTFGTSLELGFNPGPLPSPTVL